MPVPGKDKKKKVKMEKEKAAQIKSTQLLMRAIQLNYQQHWYVCLNNQYAVVMICIVIMKISSNWNQLLKIKVQVPNRCLWPLWKNPFTMFITLLGYLEFNL